MVRVHSGLPFFFLRFLTCVVVCGVIVGAPDVSDPSSYPSLEIFLPQRVGSASPTAPNRAEGSPEDSFISEGAALDRKQFRPTIPLNYRSPSSSRTSAFFQAASNSFRTSSTLALFFWASKALRRPNSDRGFRGYCSRSVRNTTSARPA